MPFPLHKAPRGLLELFRLRTLGEQPRFFGESVQPTVDVSEFYAADLKLVSISGPTVGGLPLADTLLFTAPVRLHGIGAQLLTGAAAATNVGVTVGIIRGGVTVPLSSQFYAAVPANTQCEFGIVVPAWVFVPGQDTGVYARAFGTAAGVDHSLDVRTLIDNITSSA